MMIRTFKLTAPQLKHFSNLHGALRTHMHSKHSLGKANTKTGCYSYYQSLLPTVHEKVSNTLQTMPTHPFKAKQNISNYRTVVPLKRVPMTKFQYSLRSEGGAGGTGSTQRQPQPLHILPRPATLVSSFQNRGTSISWRSNTVKTPGQRISWRPPSSSTATSAAIFQGPQL
eukprot:1148047-Pelagomonas_calceolata.AAC.1